MKLPGYEAGAVQKIHTVDPGVYRARGQAAQQLTGAVASAAQLLGDKQNEWAQREALVEMSNGISKFRETYGNKSRYTAEDLDALGIEPTDSQRYREWVDDSGQLQKEEKTEFDAEDFYADALAKKWKATAELAAKRIQQPNARSRFMASQQEMINNAHETEVARGYAAKMAKQNTRYELDIQNAQNAGNYQLSAELLRQHPGLTDEQRELEVEKNYQDEESHYLFIKRVNEAPRNERGELIAADVPEYQQSLEEQIKRLESPLYGGDKEGKRMNSMTKPQREAEIQRLRAAQKFVEKDVGDQKARNLTNWYNNLYARMQEPGSSRQDGLEMIDRAVAMGVLKPSDWKWAMDFVEEAKGGGPVADRTDAAAEAFVELTNMPVAELQRLNDAGQLVGKLIDSGMSAARSKEILQRANGGINDEAEWTGNYKYAEDQLGLKPGKAGTSARHKYDQTVSELRVTLSGMFRAYTAQNGSPPDAAQRQEMTDRLLITENREIKKAWFWGDDEYVNRDVKLTDTSYQEWATIRRALAASGDTQPTALDYETMSGVLSKMDKAGLDNPTTSQIVEAARLLEQGMPLGQWAKEQRKVPAE